MYHSKVVSLVFCLTFLSGCFLVYGDSWQESTKKNLPNIEKACRKNDKKSCEFLGHLYSVSSYGDVSDNQYLHFEWDFAEGTQNLLNDMKSACIEKQFGIQCFKLAAFLEVKDIDLLSIYNAKADVTNAHMRETFYATYISKVEGISKRIKEKKDRASACIRELTYKEIEIGRLEELILETNKRVATARKNLAVTTKRSIKQYLKLNTTYLYWKGMKEGDIIHNFRNRTTIDQYNSTTYAEFRKMELKNRRIQLRDNYPVYLQEAKDMKKIAVQLQKVLLAEELKQQETLQEQKEELLTDIEDIKKNRKSELEWAASLEEDYTSMDAYKDPPTSALLILLKSLSQLSIIQQNNKKVDAWNKEFDTTLETPNLVITSSYTIESRSYYAKWCAAGSLEGCFLLPDTTSLKREAALAKYYPEFERFTDLDISPVTVLRSLFKDTEVRYPDILDKPITFKPLPTQNYKTPLAVFSGLTILAVGGSALSGGLLLHNTQNPENSIYANRLRASQYWSRNLLIGIGIGLFTTTLTTAALSPEDFTYKFWKPGLAFTIIGLGSLASSIYIFSQSNYTMDDFGNKKHGSSSRSAVSALTSIGLGCLIYGITLFVYQGKQQEIVKKLKDQYGGDW
jgi:hypothetical protein